MSKKYRTINLVEVEEALGVVANFIDWLAANKDCGQQSIVAWGHTTEDLVEQLGLLLAEGA
jgi:hypothetical protein